MKSPQAAWVRALPSSGAVAGAPKLEATALIHSQAVGAFSLPASFTSALSLCHSPAVTTHAQNRKSKRQRDIKTGKQYAHLAGEIPDLVLCTQVPFVLSNHHITTSPPVWVHANSSSPVFSIAMCPVLPHRPNSWQEHHRDAPVTEDFSLKSKS